MTKISNKNTALNLVESITAFAIPGKIIFAISISNFFSDSGAANPFISVLIIQTSNFHYKILKFW